MSKEPKRNVYVGHRYVPKIMGEWDKQETYEGLSIVTHQGTSYTSKKHVPVGIDILDEEYWAVTGNYNAQIEYYRKDVRDMQEKVTKEMENVIEYVEENVEKLNDHLIEVQVNVNDFEGDDNEKIQNAINYAYENNLRTVYIPEGVYELDVTRYKDNGEGTVFHHNGGALYLRDNIDIVMHKKAVLKALPTEHKQHNLFILDGVENVSISGGVLIGERYSHLGTDGEHGFGIQVKDSKNVTIENCHISNFWGDGIYVGDYNATDVKDKHNENIVIRNVVCDSNRRQGMSITDGVNIEVYDSIFKNTYGTAPQDGIDVEPNEHGIVINIRVVNCRFINNAGVGVHLSRSDRYGDNKAILNTVHFQDCYFDKNRKAFEILGREYGIENVHLENFDIESSLDSNDMNIRKCRNINMINIKVDNARERSFYILECDNLTISQSTIRNASDVGIYLIDTSNSSISNNIIENCRVGIDYRHPGSLTKNIIINNNEFRETRNAISFNSDVENVSIYSNYFYETSGYSIFTSSNASIKNIFIDSNKINGGVYLRNTIDMEIINNSIIANLSQEETYRGVLLNNTSGLIKGNTINSGYAHSIYGNNVEELVVSTNTFIHDRESERDSEVYIDGIGLLYFTNNEFISLTPHKKARCISVSGERIFIISNIFSGFYTLTEPYVLGTEPPNEEFIYEGNIE